MSQNFREIERFLQHVRQPSLFSYLNLSPAAAADTIRKALQARRVWAQSQQSNPRHREEALWLIRNRRLLDRALLEERGAYLQSLARARQVRALTHVRHFMTIMGINEETLPVIRSYARRSGLNDTIVEQLIEREKPDLCYSSAGFSAEVA